ncbi:MAG: hypothetical protein J6Q84_07570 [Kiritimatiellae bacterium]|nr:hypothetical protein [Kiritimatiellia bacterium]
MTRRSQKLQEARERRYRQEVTYKKEETKSIRNDKNVRKDIKVADTKKLAMLYQSMSNLFGKKIAEKVMLGQYREQISFFPNETFLNTKKELKNFYEYFVRVTPKTHLIYEIVAKSKNASWDYKQIDYLRKAVEERYGASMAKSRYNEYVLEGKDGPRSRVLKIVSNREYLQLSLLDIEGQKQAEKENEEIAKFRYDELSTLFGIRLGDKINGEQNQVLIPIYPKRKFLQYNDYYIKITPKTHLVYEIRAKAEVDISSVLEDFEILTRKAVESKYGFYMNEKKKDYSTDKEYSLEGVDEKKRRLLKIIKDYKKVELSLVDIDLSNLAHIENKEIENDIKTRKEQSRNSIAEGAADAL